ncbi:hypothetical protein DV738_g5105, partial [Chaetothyriales sp. CBS 135597]
MATGKEAVSFDEIIQAGRARSRNEQLANEIFGRNRRKKDSNDRGNRASSQTPSLASRAGVQKRSSSSSSTNTPRPTPTSRTSSAVQAARTSRIQSALESPLSSQANISKSRGIAIKGAAGPFTVVATNFAPGTTAADIESAVAHDGADVDGNNTLLSCRLTSSHRDPIVTAELVYSDREVAERIVSLYNNQRADGRILKLSIQPTSGKALFKPTAAPSQQPQSNPGAALLDDEDDVDMLSPDPPPNRYNTSREASAAAHTRLKEDRRAEPDRHDERYAGAPDAEAHVAADGEDGVQRADATGDDLSRSRERDANTRDRERDRDRGRDRRDDQGERRYDDRRDGDYDRRPYEQGPGWDPPRGGWSSHYGNGVGGVHASAPHGGYAGGYGGPGRGNAYAGPRGPRGGGFGRSGYGGRGW